jgi:hypothetical protein
MGHADGMAGLGSEDYPLADGCTNKNWISTSETMVLTNTKIRIGLVFNQ